MGELIYGSYLMRIFAKMTLPNLSRISLFYFGTLILCDQTMYDTEWCDSSGLDRYTNNIDNYIISWMLRKRWSKCTKVWNSNIF